MEIIVNAKAPISFNDLKVGDLFMFHDHVYMVTGLIQRFVKEERFTTNSIEMDSGRFRLFKGTEMVKKVKGTLVIEEE